MDFSPGIKRLTKIERTLVPDAEPPNPFKTWLEYKGRSILKEEEIDRTHYLKKVAITPRARHV